MPNVGLNQQPTNYLSKSVIFDIALEQGERLLTKPIHLQHHYSINRALKILRASTSMGTETQTTDMSGRSTSDPKLEAAMKQPLKGQEWTSSASNVDIHSFYELSMLH
jgi:hypothetical protein